MTRSLSLVAALAAVTVGCTAAPAALTPPPPPPGPDASAPEVLPPPPEAGVDRPPDGNTDAPADEAARDAPKPWPPPGTDYLTKLATEADFNQLSGPMNKDVPFIMRRRPSDKGYPYPWDGYECVFENGRFLHITFLEAMDPERALYLYYADAKSIGGSLIPGRIYRDATQNPKVFRALFENTTSLMSERNDYPLDAATGNFLREQLSRCAPFARSFTISVVCPGGTAQNCPLP